MMTLDDFLADLNAKRATETRIAPAMQLRVAPSMVAVGEIVGLASPFGGEADSYGDVILPGAYTRSLAEHQAAGTFPKMLWSHDKAKPVGRWTEMRETPHGLVVAGRLNLDTTNGRDAHAHLKSGDIDGLSIGFRVFPGGETFNAKGGRNLTAIDLHEISLVSLPAARSARVTDVKQVKSERDLAEMLTGAGLNGSAARKVARAGWPALAGGSEPETPNLGALIAAVKAARAELKTKG